MEFLDVFVGDGKPEGWTAICEEPGEKEERRLKSVLLSDGSTFVRCDKAHDMCFTCLFLRKIFLVEMTSARDSFLSLQML